MYYLVFCFPYCSILAFTQPRTFLVNRIYLTDTVCVGACVRASLVVCFPQEKKQLVFDSTVGGDAASTGKLTVDDLRFLFAH